MQDNIFAARHEVKGLRYALLTYLFGASSKEGHLETTFPELTEWLDCKHNTQAKRLLLDLQERGYISYAPRQGGITVTVHLKTKTSSKTEALPSKTEIRPSKPEDISKTEALPSKTEAPPSKTEALSSKTEAPPSKTEALPSKTEEEAQRALILAEFAAFQKKLEEPKEQPKEEKWTPSWRRPAPRFETYEEREARVKLRVVPKSEGDV